MAALLLASASTSSAQDTIYESATSGPATTSGWNVNAQWIGVRFATTQSHRISALGARLGGYGTVFVAVFPIEEDLPPAPPDLDDAIFFGGVRAGTSSPLDVTAAADFILPPGEWGLVVGSDAGEFTGSAWIPHNNIEIGVPQYFRRDSLTGNWQLSERTPGTNFRNFRLFIEGEALPAECGNGFIEDGETCDGDGAGTGGETTECDVDCTTPSCGDGVHNASVGEFCDDGEQTASCDADCTRPVCGDGRVNTLAGEACDDAGASAACDANCTVAECGDGTLNLLADEECDHRGETAACNIDCTLAVCGDGKVNASAGESCDDQNDDEEDGCLGICVLSSCNNGVLEINEQCDDGRDNSDTEPDACRTDCRYAGCGDAVIDTGEVCDDGNDSNEDACLNDCDASFCGDGFVNGDEECDDANRVNSDECTDRCKEAACGDGYVQAGEICDDGNRNDDDGCTNQCLRPLCGNARIDRGEQCDDGNASENDGCLTTCRRPACGDGIVSGDEECDDGNEIDGDGCTSACIEDDGKPPTRTKPGSNGGGCATSRASYSGFSVIGLLLVAVLIGRRRRASASCRVDNR